jgi:decaprenyl-phosphate phosphoribosyltransferase
VRRAPGTYFVNDVSDIAADRLHPTKRLRSVAADFFLPLALVVGIGLLAGVGPEHRAGPRLPRSSSRTSLTVAYSTWLKMIPVVDVVAVAPCYLLRRRRCRGARCRQSLVSARRAVRSAVRRRREAPR